MKPFNETEFRELMLAARKMLWDVSEEKDDREPVSTAMAMALADMEEAVARGLKTIQSQQALLDAHIKPQPQPEYSLDSHGHLDIIPADA